MAKDLVAETGVGGEGDAIVAAGSAEGVGETGSSGAGGVGDGVWSRARGLSGRGASRADGRGRVGGSMRRRSGGCGRGARDRVCARAGGRDWRRGSGTTTAASNFDVRQKRWVLLLDVVDHLVVLAVCLSAARRGTRVRTLATVGADVTLEVGVGTESAVVSSAVDIRAEVLLLWLAVGANNR